MARRLVVADDSRTIELSVGDVAVIELPESPTTGFRWSIEFDSQLALLTSDWSASSAAIGASGVRQFTFRAEAAGTASVRAKLWRSWQGDSSVTRRHSFAFSIC